MPSTTICPDRFLGKVAIITGAAQGIGKACALRLANEGASLLLVDQARDACLALESEIKAQGNRVSALVLNMELAESSETMVKTTLAHFGRIDISIHNVGGTIWAKPFWEYTADEIEKEINRSLWPTLWSCRSVIPIMKAQQSGAIINVGSVATRGINRVPYSAAKGGGHAATVCMAMELGEYGVRVNSVAPGAIDNGIRITPRNPLPLDSAEQNWMDEVYRQSLQDSPMNRLGTVDEIAAAICFLAAPEASFITGQVLYVAGGGIG